MLTSLQLGIFFKAQTLTIDFTPSVSRPLWERYRKALLLRKDAVKSNYSLTLYITLQITLATSFQSQNEGRIRSTVVYSFSNSQSE